jgi:hypothetical protein
VNERTLEAAKAADRLFDLLPPQDVGNPKAFLSATAAILSEFPPEVQDKAVIAIASRNDRPTLKFIKSVCDELYEPILRHREREERAKSSFLALPRPQRTAAEQAAIDARVSEVRKEFGIPEKGLEPKQVNLPPSADANYYAPVYQPRVDGKHAIRVQAEIDARRAKRVAEGEAEPSEIT